MYSDMSTPSRGTELNVSIRSMQEGDLVEARRICRVAFGTFIGVQRMEAGVYLNRSQAYRQMLRRGFRTDIQGVAMHKPDSHAYNRPDAFVVDDWR